MSIKNRIKGRGSRVFAIYRPDSTSPAIEMAGGERGEDNVERIGKSVMPRRRKCWAILHNTLSFVFHYTTTVGISHRSI